LFSYGFGYIMIWWYGDMMMWWYDHVVIWWYIDIWSLMCNALDLVVAKPFKNHSKSYQNQWFWVWCLQWLEFLILAPCQEPFKNLPKSYQNQWFWACCLQCWYIDILICGIIWIWWYNGSMIWWYDGLVIWGFGASISFN